MSLSIVLLILMDKAEEDERTANLVNNVAVGYLLKLLNQ